MSNPINEHAKKAHCPFCSISYAADASNHEFSHGVTMGEPTEEVMLTATKTIFVCKQHAVGIERPNCKPPFVPSKLVRDTCTKLRRDGAPMEETITAAIDAATALKAGFNDWPDFAHKLERDGAISKQRRQAADKELDEERRKHAATVEDSEEAQDALSQAYYLIMGEAAEWSNNFGYEEAIECIDDAQRSLRATVTNGFSELAAVRADRERLREALKQLRIAPHSETAREMCDDVLNPQSEIEGGDENCKPTYSTLIDKSNSLPPPKASESDIIEKISKEGSNPRGLVQSQASADTSPAAQIKNRDEWRQDAATPLAEADALRADKTSLQGFAKELMESWPGGGIDGGELQDIAEKWGLLKPVTATGPCGEGCRCQHEVRFPTMCYRPTELLTAATNLSRPTPLIGGTNEPV